MTLNTPGEAGWASAREERDSGDPGELHTTPISPLTSPPSRWSAGWSPRTAPIQSEGWSVDWQLPGSWAGRQAGQSCESSVGDITVTNVWGWSHRLLRYMEEASSLTVPGQSHQSDSLSLRSTFGYSCLPPTVLTPYTIHHHSTVLGGISICPEVGWAETGAAPWRGLHQVGQEQEKTKVRPHRPAGQDPLAEVQRCLQDSYSLRLQQRRYLRPRPGIFDFRFRAQLKIYTGHRVSQNKRDLRVCVGSFNHHLN